MPSFEKIALSNCDDFALVDIESLEAVMNGPKWFKSWNGYACRQLKGKQVFMHRLVLGLGNLKESGGTIVDHTNGNKLDNRLCNVRKCTRGENNRNVPVSKRSSTGLKGVKLHYGKYQAVIRLNGKRKYLGCYHDPKDAALAYDKAARELHGEFARLNFPDEAA